MFRSYLDSSPPLHTGITEWPPTEWGAEESARESDSLREWNQIEELE